jgi:hypothetical protein
VCIILNSQIYFFKRETAVLCYLLHDYFMFFVPCDYVGKYLFLFLNDFFCMYSVPLMGTL